MTSPSILYDIDAFASFSHVAFTDNESMALRVYINLQENSLNKIIMAKQ